MAIKIPKNMMFGTPDIELITDNKINQISYKDNFISNIRQTNDKPYKYKNIFSKSVSCWISQDSNEPNKYVYNSGNNDENVELKSIQYGNDTIFYAILNLNKIKSDLYYSIYHPDDYAYVEIKKNFTGVPYDAKGNAAGYWVIQYDKLNDYMGEFSSKHISNTSSIAQTSDLFTTEQDLSTSDIASLSLGQVVLKYQSSNYEYSDEFTGKLYVGLGKLNPVYIANVLDYIMLSFDINFYYPNMELEQNDYTLDNESENVASPYTMETNTFMNSYPINFVSDNRFTTFDQQAKDILFNYGNGRLRAKITCNYGQYMNNDGTLAYSGTDGKTIKVGDIVELNLSRINRDFEVLKSEIVYSGNIRVNLTLEEVSKVFGISESLGQGAIINYNRTYSEIGNVGKINSSDKIYQNDVIQINVSLENEYAYTLDNIIVNGQPFTNGSSITISKSINVYVITSVKVFSITKNIGDGSTLKLDRISSPFGKASIGLVTNDTFYYGDVIKITYDLQSNYEGIMYLNGDRIFDNHELTIIQNNTITIETTSVGYHTIFEGEKQYVFEDFTSMELFVDLPVSLANNGVGQTILTIDAEFVDSTTPNKFSIFENYESDLPIYLYANDKSSYNGYARIDKIDANQISITRTTLSDGADVMLNRLTIKKIVQYY